MASFPSDRLRLALIIALSITTAYAISLSMGWVRPYWAGLAVAMCSLATMGESVFKAVQRLAGTAVAILIALILISTLAQHRWAYALVVSLWMAFCCYRMQSTQAYYFWYCSGFIVPLLSMMSGFDSQGSFYVVVERSQETVLGVLCYVVFATALSRQPATGAFRAKVHSQIEMLREYIAAIRDDVQSAGEATGSRERHGEISRAMAELPTLHASAVLESFNIRERARSWLQFIAELSRLATLLDRFHLSYTTLGPQERSVGQEMSLAALAEFEARCQAVERIIGHGEDLPVPKPVAVLVEEWNRDVASNPFAEGEKLLRRDILRTIDETTRDVHAWALDIADIRRHAAEPLPSLLPRSVWPDPESLLRSLTQFIAFWACFLLYIYIPALPDGPVVAILGAIISMNVMRQPWISPPKLFIPIALAALYGGAAHILVMPALEGFTGLGTLIFGGAFLIAYLLHTDRVQPLRSMALALFMVTLQVTNHGQTYSATYVFNLIVAVGIMLIAIRLATLFPVSWKADAVLLRLFRRYADNLDALLAGLRWDLPRSNHWFARQRRAYNMRQLAILPVEIAAWIEKLDGTAFPESERQALIRLSDQLAALSHRAADLARLRETKADERFVALLKAEVTNWRQSLQSLVAALRAADEPADPYELRGRLQGKLEAVENTIARAVEGGTVLDATPQGIAHMQRVLSAYRGVSRALIATAELAGLADWRRLTEARF